MNLHKLIFVNNACYKAGKTIKPKGVMVHSTGANNPWLKRYVGPDDGLLGKNQYNNHWNMAMDRQVCVHGFIGKLNDGTVATYQTLPWTMRGWHAGGSANNTHIGFEICEDGLTDSKYFNKVYREAVELVAMLCKEFDLDPMADGVVIDHQEGHKRGVASNHGDTKHWFPKHGKNMDTFRADVKALLGTVTESAPAKPAPAAKYELLVEVPVYSSAGAAKKREGAVSKYAPGSYFIYTKYPNGVDGMLNITKSADGAAAGAWINPADNVKQEVVKPEETPVQSTKNVYDLDYPDMHVIVSSYATGDNSFNEADCTKAIVAIKKNNPDFNIDIAKTFFKLAPIYTIDPMRAISQSILETGWFKFAGSSVSPTQNNFCGLGATGGGVAGAKFDTIENGVRAQLQHLYAYGCKDALPAEESTIVDPRFKYVTRGIAMYWEQLAGRWACPGFDGDSPEESMKKGTTYGQKIDKIYEQLKATKTTQEDILQYFPKATEEPSIEPPVEAPETNTPDDTTNVPEVNVPATDVVEPNVESIVDIIIKVLKRLAEIFINCFKK